MIGQSGTPACFRLLYDEIKREKEKLRMAVRSSLLTNFQLFFFLTAIIYYGSFEETHSMPKLHTVLQKFGTPCEFAKRRKPRVALS